MKYTLLTLTALLILVVPLHAQDQIVTLQPTCSAGPHEQPRGPFAVMVFCEDALGNYIALYYKETMGGPLDPKYPKWMLGNRMWEDGEWGSDVISFAWGPAGKNLYVGTSNIYGAGGLFNVDLINRKASKLYPKLESDSLGYAIEILKIYTESNTMEILKRTYNDKDKTWTEERTKVPIQ